MVNRLEKIVSVRKATTISPYKALSRTECDGCAVLRGFDEIVGRSVENVLQCLQWIVSMSDKTGG